MSSTANLRKRAVYIEAGAAASSYVSNGQRVGYPVESVIEFERGALHDSTFERATV